ncbi:ribonuclease H-like domain-containing protein [Tanacetum coccineum]
MFTDQIAILKRDASFKDSDINALNIQIEKLKKEKESNQIKIDNFENASKSLDKLIGSQISDNSRKGVGFESCNVVPPLPTGLFAPPTIDLSNSGLKEFQQHEFEGYGLKANNSVCENSSNEIKKTTYAPIIEDWVSDCDEDESEVMVLKSDKVQHKPQQASQPKKVSQNLRNNKTNWNEIKTQKLGVGFQFTKKACFVCGCFNHLIKDCDFHDKNIVQTPMMNNVKKGTGQREVRPVWNNAMRVNHQNFSNSRRNFVPTAVLTKSGILNSVNTAKGKRVTIDVGEQGINAVKSLACWDDPQVALKDTWIFDSGCSRHMTGNKSYLTDYQDYDGGFVAFAGSSKGGRITGKGKIRSGKLDFEDVCDNGTEFKNYDMNQLCGIKGIKREFSNARTSQQNGVAERKNRTLIEAARTMLADSLLPIPFWAEAVNTACYVQNRAWKIDYCNTCLETYLMPGQAEKRMCLIRIHLLPLLAHSSSNVPSNFEKNESSPKYDAGKKNEVKDLAKEGDMNGPGEATNTDNTNRLNIVCSLVNTDTADLQDTGIFGSAYDDEYVGAKADLSNLETNMSVSHIPTTRIHKDHPKAQIIREVDSAIHTRRMPIRMKQD